MPNYTLHMGNRLESFIENYGSILKPDSLFDDKLYIVVQNKSIGEWLKLEIAKYCGISANLIILLPENALRSFVRSFENGRQMLYSGDHQGEKAVLFMDNLKIIIYKKLEELLNLSDHGISKTTSPFGNLEKYVKGLKGEGRFVESTYSLRLYQLSDSIAGLFYFYGMNCQQLTASWERGELFFPNNSDSTMREHEKWQMALWNELFKKDSAYIHLSTILTSIAELGDPYDGESCRLVLFGSTFMGDSSLRFFNYLSNFIKVDHFILSPSSDDGIFEMDLLKSWGSLFEGFKDLLKSSEFSESGSRENSFVINHEKTALSELQNRMMNNSITDEKFTVPKSDDSLKIISTTGKWREVEALKNRILRLLDEDANLQLSDIGVLAPDINEYSHFIEALFPSKGNDNLPYNIIDLKGDEDSPFISGFLSLLDLCGSRFTRKEIFSLFSNRTFAEKNRISSGEYQNWLQLCDRINIKWAVDEDHKRDMNIGGDRFNTWERGFDRIIEGFVLSETDDPWVLPFELFNESSNVSAGKMIHILRSLHGDLNSLNGVKLQLEEWILLWETIMDTYLKPVDSHPMDAKDRLQLKACFRDILNMLNDLNNLQELDNRLFDFFMFKSLLTEFINKSGRSRGRYLTQGISCSSLKPLRAVPFKVLLVLGMNEESFPLLDEPLSYDLKESSYVKNIISIDLSRQTSDKYSFLEIFLSAREKVYLFYRGKNNIDNEILQPSSLIGELEEYVNKNFICEDGSNYYESILESEKLQAFDKAYFNSDSPLYSYSKKDFDLANIYYKGEKTSRESKHFDKIPLGSNESILEVSINEIYKFLMNPLKYFFNKRMGIYIEEKLMLEEDSYENIELDFFEKRSFFKELVLSETMDENSLQSLDILLDNYCLLENRKGELIHSDLAIPHKDKLEETARAIVENLKNDHLLSSKPEPKHFVFGEVENLDKGIIQSPSFTLSSGLEVKIVGNLPPLYFYPDKTVLYVNIISSAKDSLHHWFLPYITSRFLPPKITSTSGLVAQLVSPKEIFKQDFGKNDSESMENLLNMFIRNLEKPIPLYPELANMLYDKKNPSLKREASEFKNDFLEKWSEREKLEYAGYSEFKQCSFKSKIVDFIEEIEGVQLLDLYDSFYGALLSELNEKGEA